MRRLQYRACRHAVAVSVAVLGLLVGRAEARDAGFADDFTTDSTRFSSGSFNGRNGDFSVVPVPDGLRLEVGTDDREVPGSAFISAIDDRDAFGFDVTLLGESDFSASATVYLEAVLYSETPEPGDRDRDVELQMTYDTDVDGNFRVDYCLLRQIDDGPEEALSEFGGAFCGILDAGRSIDGIRQSMDVSFDRDTGEIALSFGTATRTLTLTDETYPATLPLRRMQLWMNFGSRGQAAAELHAIRLGDETLDPA